MHPPVSGSQNNPPSSRAFIGSWRLEESRHFGGYMLALGIGLIMRKLVKYTKDVIVIDVSPSRVWTVVNRGRFHSWEQSLEEDREVRYASIDGREVTGVLSFNGSITIKEVPLNPNKRGTTITASIIQEGPFKGQLLTECKCQDVIAQRRYRKVE